jgi:hypothetical protein
MGNDLLLDNPGSWPRFQPGDDLSGHALNPLFVRDRRGEFCDVSGELGLVEPGVSRGVATADVDGDGRLDFAVANQWAPPVFHRNTRAGGGSFLGLHILRPLKGAGVSKTTARPGHPGAGTRGRPAIGTSADVHLPDGRTLHAQVDGGNGHSGKRSPDLHFGLGNLPASTRLAVTFRWRDVGGSVRSETLLMGPGWQTVMLAGPGPGRGGTIEP